MIVVDTNVISQIGRPDSPVPAWLSAQDESQLRLVATSISEVVYGLHRMPDGQRKRQLLEQWEMVIAAWGSRVLTISGSVAHLAGVLKAERELIGRPLHIADAQIAAGALVHGAALATRNVKDFEGLGIELIDPWAA